MQKKHLLINSIIRLYKSSLTQVLSFIHIDSSLNQGPASHPYAEALYGAGEDVCYGATCYNSIPRLIQACLGWEWGDCFA